MEAKFIYEGESHVVEGVLNQYIQINLTRRSRKFSKVSNMKSWLMKSKQFWLCSKVLWGHGRENVDTEAGILKIILRVAKKKWGVQGAIGNLIGQSQQQRKLRRGAEENQTWNVKFSSCYHVWWLWLALKAKNIWRIP